MCHINPKSQIGPSNHIFINVHVVLVMLVSVVDQSKSVTWHDLAVVDVVAQIKHGSASYAIGVAVVLRSKIWSGTGLRPECMCINRCLCPLHMEATCLQCIHSWTFRLGAPCQLFQTGTAVIQGISNRLLEWKMLSVYKHFLFILLIP